MIQHKDFKTTEEIKKKMYLNISDIKKLINTEIIDKDLDEVRDAFLLICLLGIRVSDFHQLNKSNITKTKQGYTFNFQCQKTKNFLNIPIHIKGIEILKKYKYKLPVINKNTINSNIKKINLHDKASIKENRNQRLSISYNRNEIKTDQLLDSLRSQGLSIIALSTEEADLADVFRLLTKNN